MPTIIDGSVGSQFPTTIGVGNATPSTSGAGITFPATQSASSDANTLDDYEEGTWTPTWQNGVTSPTYSDTSGNYTKIGRLVTFTARLQAPTGTANGNQLLIGGLPFTTSASAREGSACLGYQGALLTSNQLTLYIGKSSTNIELYHTDGTTLVGTEANSVNATLHFSGFYYV